MTREPTTTASSCSHKAAYASREEAQVHLDLLLLSQPHGGARVYRCNNEGGGTHYHISGRPAHVYTGKEPRWKKRARRKSRRRHDDEPDERPVWVGRNLFVGEITDMLGAENGVIGETTLVEAKDIVAGQPPDHLGDHHISPIAPSPDADSIGYPGTDFAMVPVNEINVDPLYQRALSASRVNAIAENLDIFAFGVVYLSQREDGSLWALDGQHRVAAIETKYGPNATMKVPALILRDLTREREAEFYYIMNRHRLQPTAHDAFRAKLAFGDEATSEIKRILDERGIMVRSGMTSAILRFNEVQAIAEIESLYRMDWLEEVLDLIGEAWQGKEGAHRANYLKGIRTFLETFHHELYGDDTPERLRSARRERLVDSLASLGPTGMDSRAKFYADTINARIPVGMARGIHAKFNQNLRGVAKLPMWGEKGIIEDESGDAS